MREDELSSIAIMRDMGKRMNKARKRSMEKLPIWSAKEITANKVMGKRARFKSCCKILMSVDPEYVRRASFTTIEN